MKIKRRTKSAYSLLELLVASAIFAGMIVAATAALSAASSLHAKEQASYEVTNYTQSLMRQISQQVSHATAIRVGLSPNNNYLVITLPSTDQYGRNRPTSSGAQTIGYCSQGYVFKMKTRLTWSTYSTATPTSILSGIGCTGTANGYKVTFTADSITSNSVQIKLIVSGSIGGGEVRSGSSLANQVSFTESAIVEYQNTNPNNLPFSQETTQ